jgi:glycolate oxidase FAD binding subunit
MNTERSVVPAVRDALTAACPSVREGGLADAVAGVVPSLVAAPASTEEASALLRAAAAAGLAVVPRGAGTGLSWGPAPAACDLVADTRSMDQVLEHAAGDLVARVQAGASLGQVASVLASRGQQLALDAPADATVGGVIATGTAGPRRFRYGTPRDLLIGITVVRADGTMARSGGKVVKNVAGYDLGKLFAGSQGTLGLITEAIFRLHPVPPAAALVTGEFGPADRDSAYLDRAASAVAAAAGSALVPSAVELDWPGSGPRVLRVGVLLEGTPSGVTARAKEMSELLGSAGGTPATAVSKEPFRWWDRRPDSGSPGTVIRISFWVSRLAEVLAAVEEAAASGIRPAVTGSAGAGVLYAWFAAGTADEAAAEFVTALRERLAVPAGSAPRGSVTVLAAPRGSAPVLGAVGAYRQVPGLTLMRAVKDQFDPDHRMFPGRAPWAEGASGEFGGKKLCKTRTRCARWRRTACTAGSACRPARPTSCGARRWTRRGGGSTW